LKYYFPFSHVKVPSLVLKELQTPLKVTTGEISIELKNFVEKFPFSVFPQQKSKVDNDVSNSTFQQTPHDSRVTDKLPAPIYGRQGHLLKVTDIEKCKQVLLTEEMARIIGVVTHFSYWQIFGHLNPVQPDLITKKQMILISIEQINVLRKKVKNVKLWSLFVFPMMILTIRMMSEFILRNNYNEFFVMEKPCCIALEKLNLLISNMFDPNMLYSRFAFFESEIEAVNKKFAVSGERFFNIKYFHRTIWMRLNFDQREYMEQILILISISQVLKVISLEILDNEKLMPRVRKFVNLSPNFHFYR